MAMQAAVKKPGKTVSKIPPAPPLNLSSASRDNIPPAPPLNLPCGSRGDIPPAPPLNLKLGQPSRFNQPASTSRAPSRSTLRTDSYAYNDPWNEEMPSTPALGAPMANSTMAEELRRSQGSPRRDQTYRGDYTDAGNASYRSGDMSVLSLSSDHTYEPFVGATMPVQDVPRSPRPGSIGRTESVHSMQELSPQMPIKQAFGQAHVYGATAAGSASPEFTYSSNPFAKPGPCDPYVGSSLVVGLKKGTFRPFIKDVDAAFVLFYDPREENCLWAKKGMKKAALVTNRPNHVFAAVDCSMECELCTKLKVTSYPTMKLFARGAEVNTFTEDTFLSVNEMKRFVEKAPCFGAKGMAKDQCSVQ